MISRATKFGPLLLLLVGCTKGVVGVNGPDDGKDMDPPDAGKADDPRGRDAGDPGDPGDGGSAPLDGGDSNDECTACVGDALSWSFRESAYQYRVSLEPCNKADISRTQSGHGSTTCSSRVPRCEMDGALVTIAEVQAALTAEDVAAAFDSAPVRYGRINDATPFTVLVAGKQIQVGEPCAHEDTECVAAPPGVTTLRDTLARLARQEASRSGCEESGL